MYSDKIPQRINVLENKAISSKLEKASINMNENIILTRTGLFITV